MSTIMHQLMTRRRVTRGVFAAATTTAIALYAGVGYVVVPGFGHYAGMVRDTLDADGRPVLASTGYKVSTQWKDAQGRNIAAPCDIYSLGVIAYELLTGRRPSGLGEDTTVEFEDGAFAVEERKRRGDVGHHTSL